MNDEWRDEVSRIRQYLDDHVCNIRYICELFPIYHVHYNVITSGSLPGLSDSDLFLIFFPSSALLNRYIKPFMRLVRALKIKKISKNRPDGHTSDRLPGLEKHTASHPRNSYSKKD